LSRPTTPLSRPTTPLSRPTTPTSRPTSPLGPDPRKLKRKSRNQDIPRSTLSPSKEMQLSTSPSKCPHCTIHSWLPHSSACPNYHSYGVSKKK
jgi:hypothetical protein